MTKRILLFLCLTAMAGSTVWADIASGKFKSGNGRWSIDDEGTLFVNINSISSDFKMPDWGEGKAPWYNYRDEIKAIHIGSNLRNIGRNAFYGLEYVENVTGGENVESVAMFAFQECGYKSKHAIPSITFPKCSYVGERAFWKTVVSSISMPLVETYKAEAIKRDRWSDKAICNMIDLGSKVKMLRPGSVDGPEYVFIEHPTPPDWERLYSTDESYWIRQYAYPFGEGHRYDNVFVIVPKEYLQTYIDYYPSKHPEVGYGYMSACYEWSPTKDKDNETYNRGKLVAGTPIYEDGQFMGGWYVEEDTLNVLFNDKTMPSYESGNAPWNSVLGTVKIMNIRCFGEEFTVPAGAFNAATSSKPALKGIQSISFSGNKLKRVVIGDYAFKDNKDLTKVSYGEITTQIGIGTYTGCENLIIAISAWAEVSSTYVPDYAFFTNRKMARFDFYKIKTIGISSFEGTSLREIDISPVESVGSRSFANSDIEVIHFGASSKKCKFGSKCFADCNKLKGVYVNSELDWDNIPNDMFDGIDLSSINLHVSPDLYAKYYEKHPLFGQMKVDLTFNTPVGSREDGWRISIGNGSPYQLTIYKNFNFSSEEEQPWYYYREYITEVSFESEVTSIGDYELAGLRKAHTITIRSTCKSIGNYAFKDCSSVYFLNIWKVETIGNNAFENCSNISRMDLGMGLKKAGDYIFKHCTSLEYIDNMYKTPAEVTPLTFAEIGSEAYHLRGGRRKAANGQAAVTLNVPDEFVTNYIIDPNWGKFHIKFADGRGTWEHAGRFGDGTWILYDDSTMVVAAEKATGVDYVNFPTEIYKMTKRIEISGSITSLGDCFKYFENLESVSLCPSIKALNGTFYYCSKLWEINLGNVETIGDDTFINCGMTTIDLSNVKNVGKYAFESCQELVTAKLGSSCVVDKRVFSNCSALSLVDLGNANLDNAVGCFNACDNLKKIAYNGQNLPKGIFSGCTALEEVKLGSRVRSIQWSAFEGCTALKTIYCDSPMPPSLPIEKTQDIIGYEGTGDVQTPILGPEYDVWAFHDLDRPSIKLYVHPDCVPVYGRFDVWKEMDIQGNAEDVDPLLPTGGSLRGSGKDENGDHVISGSTWYLDEEGKLTLDALGNIAARTSDNNYWWSVFDSYLPFIATVEVTDDVTGVPNNMFGWIDSDRLTRGVTTVILGEGLKKAGYDTFHFSGIKDVYLYAENLVDFHGATFNREAAIANNATLHVLKDPENKYLNYYKVLPATKDFPNIVADLDPRHPKVQAVNFDFSEITLRPGQELQLEPRFTPADVEDKTLRYVDVSNGHHVYVDSDNGIIFAQSEGVAYIEAFSSYTVSGEEVMALWGPTQEIYLKINITEPEPGEEIFFDYREGEGTDAPIITCHVLRDEQVDVDTWVKTCEIAGQYNEDDITTQAIPEWRTGTVNIPEEAMGYEVTRIGAFAFYERSISTLYIPWTVTQIGYNACSRCDYLTDVYIPSYEPLRLTDAYGEEDENLWNNDAFYRIGEGDDGEGFATLHVPAGSKAAWDIYPWNEWFRYIMEDAPIPDGIKDLKDFKDLKDSWFDLSGRKLGSKPAKAGLYIFNGRKIVIK